MTRPTVHRIKDDQYIVPVHRVVDVFTMAAQGMKPGPKIHEA
jgi:hypothetical protein